MLGYGKVPKACVWPPQSIAKCHQPSHMVPIANGWASIVGYMPGSLPYISLLCPRRVSNVVILVCESAPSQDTQSAQGACLTHPIHCQVSSTVTYGPNSKWMGIHCGVHAWITAIHQPSLPQEGLKFCDFGMRKPGHAKCPRRVCLTH